MTGAAATTAANPAIAPEPYAGTPRSEDLGAPLYVAWQITNECNLACLHCIEESGPARLFATSSRNATPSPSSTR